LFKGVKFFHFASDLARRVRGIATKMRELLPLPLGQFLCEFLGAVTVTNTNYEWGMEG
jgi:hypothetical protein